MMMRPIKAKALERLRRALDAIPKLKNLRRNSSEFKKWRRNTEVAIIKTFGSDSSHISTFKNIRFSPGALFAGMSNSAFQKAYARGLESVAPILESMIEEIEEYWEDGNQTPTPIPSEIHENEQINTNEVFIVHGRDEGTKSTVARFLEKLALKPIILGSSGKWGGAASQRQAVETAALCKPWKNN